MRKKIIYGCESRGDGDKPYLIRWELFKCKYFNIYLHKFLRSDADEHHDHTWNFYSFVFKGGYIEEIPSKTWTGCFKEPFFRKHILIKPFSLLYRPATHRHRVVLHKRRNSDGSFGFTPAWSIVITGKYIRQWGFYTKRGWKNFKDYFKENGC